jgi:hypothetical protein
MLRDNIIRVYERASALQPHRRIISLYIDEKLENGHFEAQRKDNIDRNIWNWGIANNPLIDGEIISAISVCDGEHTVKYSDEYPEGIITGKSGTSRQARPMIY